MCGLTEVTNQKPPSAAVGEATAIVTPKVLVPSSNSSIGSTTSSSSLSSVASAEDEVPLLSEATKQSATAPSSSLSAIPASIPVSASSSSSPWHTVLLDAIKSIFTLAKPDGIAGCYSTEHQSTIPNAWRIHGVEYDLSSYIDKHPGGREAILLGQSRDCTALFESYHPFTTQHRRVLEKFQIHAPVPVGTSPLPPTPVERRDFFYDLLCARVEAVLKANGIDPIQDRTASPSRMLYYAVIVAATVATGYWHVKGSILGSFLFAIFGWLIGALGHDGGHFSVSRTPWINDCAVWGISWLCNPIMWQHQHTYSHHSFTNEFEHDVDLHHFKKFMRIHPRFEQDDKFLKQTEMWFVIRTYMFVVLGTCFMIPLGMFVDGTLYDVVEWTDAKRWSRLAGFFAHLSWYVLFVMVAPFVTQLGTSWLYPLVAVFVHVSTSGFVFAIFSQINHINELAIDKDAHQEQQKKHRDPRLADSWAVAQIETSNDFCPQSTFWYYLSNGLNNQISHHCFPGVNHCHLPLIAPVVRATCEEYGVQYKCYESWWAAMQSTLDWYAKLAFDTEPAALETPPRVATVVAAS